MSKRFTKNYSQNHPHPADEIFPLLCPVREHDWLEGWKASIVHSESGIAEQDAVFTTPHEDGEDTVWTITEYDPENRYISFVRYTPGHTAVTIKINVESMDMHRSRSHISYQFTILDQEKESRLYTEINSRFEIQMEWWEKAINHYLSTGRMLTETND